MKKLTLSLIAFAISASTGAFAKSVAITNTTVYTGTDQGVITNANVVIEDGKIVAVNPSTLNVDETVDGKNRILTAGFVSSLTGLGLVEVDAVSASRDARPKKMKIDFSPALAFNPNSSIIPFTRKGGITHSLVKPSGSEGIWGGQVIAADSSGDYDSVINDSVATIAYFGSQRGSSRAVPLLELEKTLSEHKEKLAKAAKKDDKKDDKEPSAQDKVLNRLLSGEQPLVANVTRASDILHLLKMKEKFGLNLVLNGAGDAVRVKEQLAAARVPVILQAVTNLPGSFDSLQVDLTNAAELSAAGVKIIINQPDTHISYNLRTDVGIAIAHGLDRDAALHAVTKNPAEVFGLPGGVIAEGEPANLVLWSGDPFEISSKVEVMWIDGEIESTESRQDKLRDRYMSDQKTPRSYVK